MNAVFRFWPACPVKVAKQMGIAVKAGCRAQPENVISAGFPK